MPKIPLLVLSAVVGCTSGAGDESRANRESSERTSVLCLVAPAALLRPELVPSTDSTWIQLDSPTGVARIIQSDRARLEGTWQLTPWDSVAINAFDDLVRLEIRIPPLDTIAPATARLTSDAAVDPATGQIGLDLTRTVTFREISCVRVPRRSTDSLPRNRSLAALWLPAQAAAG